MIVVRNTFQLAFGKAKEGRAMWQDGKHFAEDAGAHSVRMLTDLTGPSYTLVLEFTYDDLAAFEAGSREIFGSDEWQAWYRKFVPLVMSGHREIYTVVE